MKWNNKGHQFDEVGKKLVEVFHKKDGIWIFGAGIFGKDLRALLEKYDCFGGFIDSDIHKKEEISDCEVCLLEEYLSKQRNDWIVIATDDATYAMEMQEQLEGAGKTEGNDFFGFRQFVNEIFPIISLYVFEKIYAWKAEIGVTERCTLKCRKCIRGCGMVDINSKDMSIEDVKSSADFYFENFDYVTEFCLIGGEILLYKQLPEAIEYIGSRYREQMIIFSITSNGTIIPSNQLLEVMKRYHVLYRISDYSKAIPQLIPQHKKIVDTLEEGEIDYRFAYEDENTMWTDSGYEYVNREYNEKELIETFDKCLNGCRAVRKNKYYFCAAAEAVSRNLGFHVGEKDYFDLKDCGSKKELLEFNLGYSEKGYLDMCNFCHGSDREKYPIPVAEQIIGGENEAKS